MATFQYLARDATGARVDGILESNDGAALADALAANGLTLVRASEVTQGAVANASWLAQLFSQKVTTDDLLLFFRQLSTLLKAGVPILRALRGLQESATGRRFGQVLSELQQHLEGGRDLSTSMQLDAKVFSPYMVSMVRVGEVTGRLPEVLQGLFLQMSFERESREQAKAALRYPMFVVFTAIGALVAVNVLVIPAFAKVYKGLHAELPLFTTILIALSDFTVHYWPLLLGLLAAIASALSYA
ncbi:MAG TPA: type II secretion system F family protein, partial [Burkholderiaceae bacterium]|nr:type II secretion system F family protein [Burkholderiaceae bacterium]